MEDTCSEAENKVDEAVVQSISNSVEDALHFSSRIRSSNRITKPIGECNQISEEMKDTDEKESVPEAVELDKQEQTSIAHSDLSVYNFDTPYKITSIPNVQKRGRGRPRKDGRIYTHGVEHRKMYRGRGCSKREDGSTTQPKIFPGRPRMRGKKKFPPHPIKLDFDVASVSGSTLDSSVDIGGPENESDEIEKECFERKIAAVNYCSLCNLSDSSCLGQGKLQVFRSKPAISAESVCDENSVEGIDKSVFLEKKNEASKMIKDRPRRKSSSTDVFERISSYTPQDISLSELLNVGFESPPEIRQVFQTSGETYVHHNCAIFSEGVEEDCHFSAVEKAVLNGMFEKCFHCQRYGATVRCSVFDCVGGEIYHYPCAIVSDALQLSKSGKAVCASHLDSVEKEIICSICETVGAVTDLLMCTVCFKYNHGKCIEPCVQVSTVARIGYECAECKILCKICRKRGEENKILACETCDRSFHTFCLKPMVTMIPKSWKCQSCRICGDCGARSAGNGPSSRWHMNYSTCDSCYQQRNKGIACPICGKAYRRFGQRKYMKQCSSCRKYIHSECDPRSNVCESSSLDYVCPVCVVSSDGERVEDNERDDGNLEHISRAGISSGHRTVKSPPQILLSSSLSSDNYISSADSDSNFECALPKRKAKKELKKGEKDLGELRTRKKGPHRRRRETESKREMNYSPPVSGAFCFPPSCVKNPFSEPKEYKTDDDQTDNNKIVLVSHSDDFVLGQDLCVMCGSFGKDDEGQLIACIQCGECYHPYCAGIKLTLVVLTKGWRCLECTVCEGCGEPHDESRLLLCDNCDISYHIYCLRPPLSSVPQGNWKCKWCVNCVKCGATYPGVNCNWQINYTHCGPCASSYFCAICSLSYQENELIIQCCHCQRWSHGKCDEIFTEKDAEKCLEKHFYSCLLCRPAGELPPHLKPSILPPSPEPEKDVILPEREKTCSPEAEVSVMKAKPPSYFFMDGVCLSQSGLDHIKQLTQEMPKKTSRSRKKPRLDSSDSSGMLVGSTKFPVISSLNTSETSDGNMQLGQETLDDATTHTETMKTEEDLDAGLPIRGDLSLCSKKGISDGEKKKKPRKIQKLGIGGFVAKPRGRTSSLKDKDSNEFDAAMETSMSATADNHHVTFPDRSSESFSSLSQEKPKRRPRKPKKKTPLDERFPSYLRDAFFGKDLLMSCKKEETANMWDFSLQDFLTGENNSEITSKEDPISPLTLSTLSTNKECPQGDQLPQKDLKPSILSQFTQQTLKKEPVPAVFLSKESPDVFAQADDEKEAMVHIGDEFSEKRDSSFMALSTHLTPSSKISKSLTSGSIQQNPFAVQRATVQTHVTKQALPIHSELPRENLHAHDSNSSWSESDSSESSISKSTIYMKWETDENLGILSTISPVLYSNINCPHFKLEYPSWNDRVKQIAKTWRSLPSDKRQPYLQKARENRAASRTQKTTDPSVERFSKEVKSQELFDQERQWKQFQALRLLQQQKQQKIIQEQRAQLTHTALIKAQSDKNIHPYTNTELSTEVDNCSKSISSGETESTKEYIANDNNWKSEQMLSKGKDVSSASQQEAPGLQSKFELPAYQSTPSASSFLQLSHIPDPTIDLLKSSARSSSSSLASPETENQSATAKDTIGQTLAVLPSQRLTPQEDRLGMFSPASYKSLTLPGTESTHGISSSAEKVLKMECNSPASQTATVPMPEKSDRLFQGNAVPAEFVSQFTPEKRLFSPPAFETNRQMTGHPAAEQIMDKSTKGNFGMVPSPSEKQKQAFAEVTSPEANNNPMKFQDLFETKKSGPPENFYTNVASPMQSPNAMMPLQSYSKQNLKENPDISLNKPMIKVENEEISTSLSSRIKSEPMQNQLKSPISPDSIKIEPACGISKEDCFRHPFPPKYLTARDSKPDAESLGKEKSSSLTHVSSGFKPSECCEDMKSEESVSDTKTQTSEIRINEAVVYQMQGDKDKETQKGDKSRISCGNDGKETSPSDRPVSPTKRKNTLSGDILKDLESQQQGHDLIANACNLDVLPVDVGGLELDDDELLGLGNDFNILEYADPELDKSLVGEGNIFDEHLDLDDKGCVELYIERERDEAANCARSDFNTHISLSNSQKPGSKPLKTSELLEYPKKNDLKSERDEALIGCMDTSLTHPDNLKKEPNSSFSSCSHSNVSFDCSTKDVQVSPLSSMNSSKSLSELHSLEKTSTAYSSNVPSQKSEGVQFQQLSPMQQQRLNFPMHVTNASQTPSRPLLLQEQPLLLEELVEQEKREKDIRSRQTQDSILSPQRDVERDYEKLKGKESGFPGPHVPDESLSGQASHFCPPPYSLVYQNQEHNEPPSAPQQVTNMPPRPHLLPNLLPPGIVLHAHDPAIRSVHVRNAAKPPVPEGDFKRNMPVPFVQNYVSTPTSPPRLDQNENNEHKLLQYETFLVQQQAAFSSQQKFLETEVLKLRKIKKSMNAKQRQLRKNGSELNENDAVELARISQEQSTLQKQLEQIRKQTRQHAMSLQDFRTKQQKRQLTQQQISQASLPSSHVMGPLQHQSSSHPTQACHSPQQVGAPSMPQSPMLPSSLHFRQTPLNIHHPASSILGQQPSPGLSSPNLNQQCGTVGCVPPVHPNIYSQQAPQHFHEHSLPPNPPVPEYRPEIPRDVDENSLASNIDRKPDCVSILENVQREKDETKETVRDITSTEYLQMEDKMGQKNDESLIEKKNVEHSEDVKNAVSPKNLVSTSVLSQGLPSSVTYTLNFTLRQTGMPTGCLTNTDPNSAIENVEGANQNRIIDEMCVSAGSINSERVSSDSVVGLERVIKKEAEDYEDEKDEVFHRDKVAATSEKFFLEHGSSDEEMESLTKEGALLSVKNEPDCSQNVLLKQLLQNCPSAESNHANDVSLNALKQEVSLKDENGNQNVCMSDKQDDEDSKRQNHPDIRHADMEKETTPPPPLFGKSKTGKRKRERPKRKKKAGYVKEGSPVCVRKKIRKVGAPLENVITQLTNLPALRILEPIIQPNFNVLSVFGTGEMNTKGNQLKGTYGNSTLPNQRADPSSMVYSFNFNKNVNTQTKNRLTLLLPSPLSPYRSFYNQEFPSSSLSKGNSEFGSSMGCTEAERTCASRYRESPDILSSSSPESCMLETTNKWPELIFVDKLEALHMSEDTKDRGKKPLSYSPVIPLIAPIPIRMRPDPIKEETSSLEKDKENIPKIKKDCELREKCENLLLNQGFPMKPKLSNSNTDSYAQPLKDSGNVSVTVTLSSAAAEDICDVLTKLANVLKIPIPTTYDIVERTTTPPSQKLGLYRVYKKSKPTQDMNAPFSFNGKPRFCRHCDIVVLSAGLRKKACDITCISKGEQEEEDEIFFCSTNCYMQFALTHQSSGAIEDKDTAAVVPHSDSSPRDFSSLSIKAIDEDGQERESLTTQTNSKLSIETLRKSSPLSFKPITDSVSVKEYDERTDEETDVQSKNTYDNKLKGATKLDFNVDQGISHSNMDTESILGQKTIKLYKYWIKEENTDIFSSSVSENQNINKERSAERATPFYHTMKPSQLSKDSRRCLFCHATGDSDTDGAGRLLNIDVDKWVHLNCALWSAPVYETESGALVNVESAYKQALTLVCCSCHRNGASLKCFKIRCGSIYHFHCAKKENCVFYKDKTLLCPNHANKHSENELESLAVYRRVYIDRNEHKQVASIIQGEQYVLRIGSLLFLHLGQLLPQQMQAFHTPNCIYPIGYKSIRIYWSMRNIQKRCLYICSIHETDGHPEFEIVVKETGHKDLVLKEKTAKGLWQKVLCPIEKMRRQAKTIKIFPNFITGDDMFGLTEPAVLRIIESLPGVDMLQDYNFRYGRSPFLELPLAINPTGCARSEPKLRTHVKRSHTLHTSNSTKTFLSLSTLGGIEIVSPYIKQFVHSKSSQYRKMKTEWRNNVFLARSRIQGLGLYAAKDLEPHQMVIEYLGQLIRNEIAERNESIYDAQNRGIYMFRLDENRVIDATLSGGLARYMNHSCNPNCVAEVFQIDRENKILIIANRRIARGEELSYDYKFEVEDDQRKIPCLCKAPNCRKWMN